MYLLCPISSLRWRRIHYGRCWIYCVHIPSFPIYELTLSVFYTDSVSLIVKFLAFLKHIGITPVPMEMPLFGSQRL